MHKENIHVKNLKPNNILLPSSENLDIKITDTGFSVLFEQKSAPTLRASDKVWMAPEIIPKGKSKGLADVWSIGAITYWLLEGIEPLNTEVEADFDRQLKKLKSEKEFKKLD